ncbi:MAG TPA: glycosyltransferase, partial [Chloroflexia bacterium]|nr:glycosyltransferase [Chloroflexia bacterium]
MGLYANNIHLLRTLIINSVTAAVGLGLLANRRRNPEIVPTPSTDLAECPTVAIIVPARNEEANIAPLLATLLGQDYPEDRYSIILVDDGSTDRTRQIAQHMASHHPNLRLVQAGSLPGGWTGKNNAMFAGYRAAPVDASWLLFVDADTRHRPMMLSSIVGEAQTSGAGLLSLVIDVEMGTFWERLLVPQIGEVYTLLVGTMDSVNRRKGGGAAANGQCMLIRREIYSEVGALDSVRSDVAEDRAIAAACKERGYTVRLAYGRKL